MSPLLWNPKEVKGLSLFNVIPQKLLDSKAKFCTFFPRPVHCPEALLRFTQCLTFASSALRQNPCTGLAAKFGQYTVTLLLLTEEPALVVTCMISFWEVNIYGTFLSQLSVWFSGRSIWSAAGRVKYAAIFTATLFLFRHNFLISFLTLHFLSNLRFLYRWKHSTNFSMTHFVKIKCRW